MTDLTIPEFLRRSDDAAAQSKVVRRRARERRIPYPKDGYLGVGLRAAARERLRASRRRHAERCRERRR